MTIMEGKAAGRGIGAAAIPAGSPGPRVLVTGFGPFPGAPDNPTGPLAEALSAATFDFGADLSARVLPTDYRRSWAALRRIYATKRPDIVLHFGLSRRASAIQVETRARRHIDPGAPDASGFAPRSGFARRAGPVELPATAPTSALIDALQGAGIAASLSEDCGAYVCNATFYRSLLHRGADARMIGFIHVPPIGDSEWTLPRLVEAGAIVVSAACGAWLRAGLFQARVRSERRP